MQPAGATDGDGTAANVNVWVTAAGGQTILARADQSNFGNGDSVNGALDLSLPIGLGSKYFLQVQNTHVGATPSTDYYFLQYAVNLFSEVAEQAGAHDQPTTAQALPAVRPGSSLFVIDGDLAPAVGAPDAGISDGGAAPTAWFRITPPQGSRSGVLFCDAQRSGSGLLGFAASLYDSTGTTTIGGAVEGPTVDLFADALSISPNASSVLLKVSATSQDPEVGGDFYRCHVRLR